MDGWWRKENKEEIEVTNYMEESTLYSEENKNKKWHLFGRKR